MDLNAHISAVPGFYELSEADRIRFFAWFVHSSGKINFAQADITDCYRQAGLDRPDIGPYLVRMATREPPELLKSNGTYRLERRTLEELTGRYGQRAAIVKLDGALNELTAKITNADERVFFDEMLVCLRHGAFRSTVVMGWNLAYTHLCDYVFSKRLAEFNAQLKKSFPKAKPSQISTREDFMEFREFDIIQVCRSASITTSGIDKILREKLARRNSAAHPSGVNVSQLVAEETIVDLVQNVLLAF